MAEVTCFECNETHDISEEDRIESSDNRLFPDVSTDDYPIYECPNCGDPCF